MPNIYHYLRDLQYSFRVTNKAIASGLFLGLITSLGTAAISQAQSYNPEALVNRARQPAGRAYIVNLNRAQQVYYNQNGKFAASIAQLSIGIDPNTKDYSYRTMPMGNQTERVMINAIAKRPGLKSYTGAVFAIKNNRGSITVAAICETNRPTSKAPTMPTRKPSGQIQCPAGSRKI